MIKFLAEIYKRSEFPPELATATTDFSRQYNIYELLTGPDSTTEESYLSAWGIVYDSPESTYVQLRFLDQLLQVFSESVFIATVNSFYVSGDKIYIHLEKKPWQYKKTSTELQTIQGFSSAVAGKDQSDWTIGDNTYPTRMAIPSFRNELSDVISGAALFPAMNISFFNDDGFFDDPDINNYFNTTVIIKKTTKDIADYSDYVTIRRGLIEDQEKTEKLFTLLTADYFRSLTDPVTRVFSSSEFPDIESAVSGKDIPILFGFKYKMPLFKIGDNQYYIADGFDLVSAVFNSDGETINSSYYSLSGGILTMTDLTDGEPESINGYGYDDNKISQIIVFLMSEKAGYIYDSTIWDIDEVDYYETISSSINLYISSGTLQAAVKSALKNDMAYLIQKNSGLLTIRRWGEDYESHTIESWLIMPGIKQNYKTSKKNYHSSNTIFYDQEIKSMSYLNQYHNDTKEDEISGIYRKFKKNEYYTELTTETESIDLSGRLLDRFGSLPETIEILLGAETADINILDKLSLAVKIGNPQRTLSKVTDWIVRGVNPAQDSLILEENTNV